MKYLVLPAEGSNQACYIEADSTHDAIKGVLTGNGVMCPATNSSVTVGGGKEISVKVYPIPEVK